MKVGWGGDAGVHVPVDVREVLGLVGASAEDVDVGGSGGAERVVVVERVAVIQRDVLHWCLRHQVEDVSARAAGPDDADLLGPEGLVQRSESGAGCGGVAVPEGQVVLDLLPRRPWGRGDRLVECDGRVGQDADVGGHLLVLAGEPVGRGLARQHEGGA
jgi:hypothetical protein